ncbi:hypothetical protein Sjap_008874 [Stephania japonica]|uniref:Serine-threonine/tyrosine-protein kinase catalytic domain-containing protein n=1 Tax=Stephania japonica TaxID=461633 RepID=A0AAP0PF29_9MAGN
MKNEEVEWRFKLSKTMNMTSEIKPVIRLDLGDSVDWATSENASKGIATSHPKPSGGEYGKYFSLLALNDSRIGMGILRWKGGFFVKRLVLNTRRWIARFFNEVDLINRVRHKNLVRLLGCGTMD